MSALQRLRARRRQLAPLLAGVVVTVIAAAAIVLTHHPLRRAVARPAAIAAVLRDGSMRSHLAGVRWDRISTNPIDDTHVRVVFWSHHRVLAGAAVDGEGHVTAATDDRLMRVPYGNWLAYEPAVLLALDAIFLLVTVVTPWRRMRNLDALVAASLVIPVVLFQRLYVNVSMLSAAAGLAYLLVRCAWRGLGSGDGGPPATPLLATLTPRLGAERRVRWMRIALVGQALVFVMVGIGSPGPVDVAYAVMEGATNVIHGVLPYGHMPRGIFHSDTYPILTYAFYAPLALLWPARSNWVSVDGALAAAVVAALAAAWAALRCVAARSVRSPQAEEAGLRAALAVLSFPAFLITVSTGTTDVAMAAMLALAFLLWQRPAAGSAMLAVAGWFKLAPFALVPIFVAPLRGRRLLSAAAGLALITLCVLALVIGLGGVHGPAAMLHSVSFQFTRGSMQSLWSALGIEELQPIAQAFVLGLIAAAVVRLRRAPELARDRARVAALACAILAGLQLAADYWAFLYLVWFAPLWVTALFGAAEEPAGVVAPVRVARAEPAYDAAPA